MKCINSNQTDEIHTCCYCGRIIKYFDRPYYSEFLLCRECYSRKYVIGWKDIE